MCFIDKLIGSIKEKSSCLVVGLDPNIDLIPEFFKQRFSLGNYENYYQYLADIFFEYNKIVIDAVASRVAIIKPQIAFYELAGHYGLEALKKTIEYGRQKKLLILLDVKRNDVPSTANAYSKSYLTSISPGIPPYLQADAITVTPFLGFDSLMPFLETCSKDGKGLFICVKTSNPGSQDLQNLELSTGEALYIHLAKEIARLCKDKKYMGAMGYSSVGVVVGATYPEEALILRKILKHSYFLVPGFGTQGGGEGIGNFFNPDGLGAIINSSRSIMYKDIVPNAIERSIENNLLNMLEKVSNK